MGKLLTEITTDHDQIREALEGLVPVGGAMRTRRKNFQALLQLYRKVTLAKQKSVYEAASRRKNLRHLVAESAAERETIAYLMNKLRQPEQPEQWKARAKVLCNLISSHLTSEEEVLLPLAESTFTTAERHGAVTAYRSCRPADNEAEENPPAKVLRLPLPGFSHRESEGVSP